jgi:hypothetical protein
MRRWIPWSLIAAPTLTHALVLGSLSSFPAQVGFFF